MLREVCFLISHDGAVLWADASHSPVALPDSRDRWEAIWHLREELAEIAHSHPVGPAAFSAGVSAWQAARLRAETAARVRAIFFTDGFLWSVARKGSPKSSPWCRTGLAGRSPGASGEAALVGEAAARVHSFSTDAVL